jgi:hypothetical protein
LDIRSIGITEIPKKLLPFVVADELKLILVGSKLQTG